MNQPIIADLGDVMSVAIIAMGLLLAGLDLYYYKKNKGWWRWFRLTCFAVGVFWVCVYGYILLFLPGHNADWLGPVILRPGVLITLGVMTMNIIARNAQK